MNRPQTGVVSMAREAIARGDQRAAYELLAAEDGRTRLGRAELPLLADAAWFSNRHDEAIATWERAHAIDIQAGDTAAAAGSALRIALLLIDMSKMAPLRAWMRRADALLTDLPEGPIHAGVEILRSFMALMHGQLPEALALASNAIDVARRVNDRTMIVLAVHAKARALLAAGALDEGMDLLEETAVAAVSGELDPFSTGLLYCSLICACQGIGEYERADEWTSAMERWAEHNATAGQHGRCRVHRAQTESRRGDWAAAETSARIGADQLRIAAPVEEGWGLTELGNIRLRKGDLDGAQSAFEAAAAAGFDPQPGLALLLLARGDTAGAQRSIVDAMDEPMESVSKEVPPNTDLRSVPLIAARVEIAAAAGDAAAARSAADDLAVIGARLRLRPVTASASFAMGTALLSAADPTGARESFQAAARLWQELGAPYELARARAGLGAAARLAGNEERALREFRAARQIFERLGAVRDVRAVAAALGESEPAEDGPVAAGERTARVFMFTDIVKSTALVEAIGDDGWRHLLHWHDTMMRGLVGRHRGVVVSTTGDGFFITFDSAVDALACATAIQQALEEHRRTSGFALRVRSGFHRAEATWNGTDWSGSGVHVAARIGAIADGGEIIASRETAAAAGAGHRASLPRAVTLKGFSQPVEVVTIAWAGARS